MGRTVLKITLSVALAAGLLLGVSGLRKICRGGKAGTRFQSRNGKSTSCRG